MNSNGVIEENKRQVRALYRTLGGGDPHVFDKIVTSDFLNHEAKDQPAANSQAGPEGIKGVWRWLNGAFSDLDFRIEEIIGEGDLVAARVTATGRHTGSYRGFEGTGKAYNRKQMHFFRCEDGRIAEHWAVRDDLGSFMQLGFIEGDLRRPE